MCRNPTGDLENFGEDLIRLSLTELRKGAKKAGIPAPAIASAAAAGGDDTGKNKIELIGLLLEKLYADVLVEPSNLP